MFNFMRLPPLRRLMLMKAITGGGSWSTISGNPVSFTAKAAPLKQLQIAFSPVQSGSGDPSPDNVRPISGWDGVEIYLQSAYDPTAQPSISISFGSTLYSGTLDVLTGVVTVDSVEKMASSLSWGNNASYANTFNGEGFTTRKRRIDGSNANGCYCDSYKWYTSGEVGSSDGGVALANASSGTVAAQTRIYIKDTRFATAGEFAASLNTNDVKIVCPLAEPLTIQLTPQEVSSLLGDNIMWSDANGDLTVTYAADPATTPIVGKGKVGQAIIGG